MFLFRSTSDGAAWKCLGCRKGAADGSIPVEHFHPQCKGLPSFGTVAEMYPRILELRDGRLLLTFTVRCGVDVLPPHLGKPSMCPSGSGPRKIAKKGLCYYDCNHTADGHGLGLRAVLSTDKGLSWDFENDRLVIGEQQPLTSPQPSGGGFGNTVEMADGHLLSVFSYKKSVPQDFRPTFIQAVRWRLPPQTQAASSAKPKPPWAMGLKTDETHGPR